MGKWSPDSQDQCRHHGQETTSSPTRNRSSFPKQPTSKSSSSSPDGAVKVLKEKTPAQGRRNPRRHRHEQEGPRRLPRRANRQSQKGRRPLLAPPEGHHDEGLRPDHLRPCREGLLQGPRRQARRHVSRNSASTSTTASAISSAKFRASPPRRRPGSKPTSRPPPPRARPSPW